MRARPARLGASWLVLLASSSALAGTGGCRAAALTVSPISLEMGVASPDALVTLRNREALPINVQVRVFRWSQEDGEDRFAPTTAVVATPPIVRLGSRSTYGVRLRRAEGGEVTGEEAYRVVIDELPDLGRQRNGAVTVLLRYNIPLFVGSIEATQPKLQWRVGVDQQHKMISAANDGDKRIQLRSLSIKAGKRSVPVAPGLAGYVLGHSTRAWALPGGTPGVAALHVLAGSDHGPIDAVLP